VPATARSIAQVNLDHEVAFVTSGHRALAHEAGGIRVLSDTHGDLGKAYRVTFAAPYVGSGVVFTCTPEGAKAYTDDHLHVVGSAGRTTCLHTAGAARRLEREGLIERNGHGEWVATERAAKPRPADDDPFAAFGAPRRPPTAEDLAEGRRLLESM